MKKWLLVLLFFLPALAAFPQADSTGSIAFSGFVDACYGYDFNEQPHHERPGFLYNHNRHDEFNVNLAFIKGSYTTDRVRGNLALMAGTYAQYNLAAEQDLLKNLFEASAGVKLARDLWLDMGIFPSHIGFESAVSKDNYTLTRSLAAENSPYYESGAKLTYQATGKWTLTALVLNGWQNIGEQAGNSNKAIGTQLQFKPTGKLLFNSSTFIGNEKPDSTRQMRYFHDLYGSFQLNEKWKLAVVFDLGIEEKAGGGGFSTWYSPTLLLHHRFTDQFGLGARTEYYRDKNGVIIPTATPAGFQTFGYSLNLDYGPAANLLLRLEGRLLDSRDAIFLHNKRPTDKSVGITCSLAVWF